MELKKVTILLSTYNRAHLIEETLESIQKQTHINFECLITDDRSTDNTKEVVENFSRNDSRFEYFLKPKHYVQGLSANRNYGLDLAEKRNAKYLQFFDDDDIMHPKMLEMKIRPLLIQENIDLSICKYRKFHKLSTINFNLQEAEDYSCKISSNDLLTDFYLNKINFNSPSALWKFEIFRNYRFNEALFFSEEKELFLRIFLNHNIKHVEVPFILFWYRKHNKAITSNLYDDQFIKTRSSLLAEKLFFEECLKNGNTSLSIIQTFLVKYSNTSRLQDIKRYLRRRFRNEHLKYWFIILKFKMRLIYRKYSCK